MAPPPSPHRSHSPFASKSDANSKNLDCNRRSFSGTPIHPKPSTNLDQSRRSFNSHSEFGRRNSICKDVFEQKENEKDHNNTKRLTSPSASKSTKNFMSPTISAAIKFTPSPRKKILSERNENHFVSFNSCSPIDSIDSGFKPDVRFKTLCSPKDEEPEADQNFPPLNKDVKGDSKMPLRSPIFSQSDLEFSDRKETFSRTLPSKSLYERDASLLPYDPETNLLSPRPKFVRYKPDWRNDDDSISEDSVEVGSEDSPDEFENVISSVESVEKEDTAHWPSDDSDSTDDTPEVNSIGSPSYDDSMEAKCVHFHAGSKFIPTQFDNPTTEGKFIPWFHFGAGYKSTALLLIFLVACLLSISFTDSPVISSFSTSSTFERHPLFTPPYQNPHNSIFTKTNLSGLTKSLQVWSSERCLAVWSMASYISGFIGSFSEGDNQYLPCYGNSTALLEDHFEENEAYGIFIRDDEDGDFSDAGDDTNLDYGKFINIEETGDFANELEGDADVEDGGELAILEHGEFSNVENGDFVIVEDGGDIGSGLVAGKTSEDDTELPESYVDVDHKGGGIANVEDRGDMAIVEDSGEIANVNETEMIETADDFVVLESEEDEHRDENIRYPEEEEIKVSQVMDLSGASESEQIEVDKESENLKTDFDVDARILGLEEKHLILVAVMLLVLATPFATMGFRASAPVGRALTMKTKPGGAAKSPRIQKKALCENTGFEESSYSKGCSMEGQSRESLGSAFEFSKDSSSSFGSFTTYQKITRKNGEGKSLTPVRRSNRIRTRLTSP